MGNVLIIISLIIAGFIFTYFILKHQLLKAVNPAALIKEIKQEIDQVIVELNRTTETNIGLLEDRINTISELLSKADKRILLLQRECEKFTLGKNYSQIVKQVEQPVVDDTGLAETAGPENTEKNRQQQVLKLLKEGIPAKMIATRLNLSIGEVELIISLNEAGSSEYNSVE